MEKTRADTNSRLKHFCRQKKFNLISNDNIKEEDLGIDIPVQILSDDFPSTESFFVEMILHKKKWLINCSCNPNKNNTKNHLETITKALDAFSTKYKNIRLLGDFNVCVDDETMINFCNSYSLNSLIKQQTCFKNTENPSCIDLILTNKPRSFQSTCVIETGLSDFHRTTVSVLKTRFRYDQKSSHTETLKNLKMRGLWIP